MLEELHIQNLAVIEDTTLRFDSSYVALVGETGAGKSLIVNSLDLLTGERWDNSLIRNPDQKASVTATFRLTDSYVKKHSEVEEYIEGSVLTLRRVSLADHSSRCYLNDVPVSLAKFKEVSTHLVNIHSQGAKSDILDEEKHIRYLDLFGGSEAQKAKEDYLDSYREVLKAREKLVQLDKENKEYDRDYLEFQIKEIKKYDLKENEIEDLNEEYENSRGYDRLRRKMEEYHQASSYPEGDITDLLGRALNKLSSFKDTSLEEEANALKSKVMELLSSLEDFEDKFSSSEVDPRRLDQINQRLFDLKGLQRKYGKSSKEILDKLHEYETKLSLSSHYEELREDLLIDLERKEKEAYEKGKLLSALRKKNAVLLDEEIGDQIASLGLRKNGFRTVIEPSDLKEDGIDSVRFEVALNEGLGFVPLSKAASGGETSRLMLALKCSLNALDPYDVLVFDEIDTGVSGRQASLIAKKIKAISKDSQIISISHLPQVVASSTSAVQIRKEVENGVTSTKAYATDEKDKAELIAKMLSGTKVTESAKEQARALIEEYR